MYQLDSNDVAGPVRTFTPDRSFTRSLPRTSDPTSNIAAKQVVINVCNLRLRTFIGFNPDERSKQQDIVINIKIGYSPTEGVFEDNVDEALNYKTITKKIIEHVENGRFLLLEKLVSDVLKICSADARTRYARVRVDKPHALRFADSVSLTLEYVAKGSDCNQENLT